jgi:hypothetical protein
MSTDKAKKKIWEMEKTVSFLSFSLKPLLVNRFLLLIMARPLYIEVEVKLNNKAKNKRPRIVESPQIGVFRRKTYSARRLTSGKKIQMSTMGSTRNHTQ